MPKFVQIEPDAAPPETKQAFNEARAQFGSVINLFKTIGSAPNVLKGVLALNKEILSTTELKTDLVEQVAMLTSALNKCDYCVNVHMAVGQSAGLSREELVLAMEAKANTPEAQALLNFANEVIRNLGVVSDQTVKFARSAGFSDKALLETIGIIGLYTTLQYIRHVTDPDHDFPIATEFNASKHGANDDTLFITNKEIAN